MIKITKEEAMKIREELKNVNVTITNRQSPSRAKTYYVEESYPVLKVLRNMHSKEKTQHFE